MSEINKMKKCINCGNELNEFDMFCPKCGTVQPTGKVSKGTETVEETVTEAAAAEPVKAEAPADEAAAMNKQQADELKEIEQAIEINKPQTPAKNNNKNNNKNGKKGPAPKNAPKAVREAERSHAAPGREPVRKNPPKSRPADPEREQRRKDHMDREEKAMAAVSHSRKNPGRSYSYAQMEEEEKKRRNLIILFAVLFVILLGILGFVAYGKGLASRNAEMEGPQQITFEQIPEEQIPEGQVSEEKEEEPVEAEIPAEEPEEQEEVKEEPAVEEKSDEPAESEIIKEIVAQEKEEKPAEQKQETKPAEQKPASAKPAVTAAPMAVGYEQGAVFASSSTTALTQENLAGLDAATLRLARNEIYARHGRMFKDANLTAYFSQFGWYQPSIAPGDFSNSMLNSVERANVALIDNYEKAMGYR